MAIRTFNYQFPGMRKPDRFVVYPAQADQVDLYVQGNRTIAKFDRITRKGMLNFRGTNSKYFLHLAPSMGAVPFTFPEDFCQMAEEIATAQGAGPINLA